MADSASVSHLLAAIDLHRWGIKGQIVALLGPYPEGIEAPVRAIGDSVGLSPTIVRHQVDELVDDRVVLRDAGAGRRGSWLVLNPAVTAWERVPWRVHPELAIHRARAVDSARNAVSAPVSARLSRLESARNGNLFANSGGASARNENLRALLAPDLANYGAPPRVSARQPGGDFANRAALARANGAWIGEQRGPGPTDLLSQSVDGNRSVSRAAGGAVRQATGAKFLKGRPVDMLAELLELYGEPAVLEAIASCQHDYRGNPMGLLDWCGDVLASPTVERPGSTLPTQPWAARPEAGCEHCDRGFLIDDAGAVARCTNCNA